MEGRATSAVSTWRTVHAGKQKPIEGFRESRIERPHWQSTGPIQGGREGNGGRLGRGIIQTGNRQRRSATGAYRTRNRPFEQIDRKTVEVNSRHAAVLALAGWYLMLPPLAADRPDVDQDAPLSTWKQGSAFDTAKDCEANLADALKRLNHVHGDMQVPSFYHEYEYARCIAVDDPRLKSP